MFMSQLERLKNTEELGMSARKWAGMHATEYLIKFIVLGNFVDKYNSVEKMCYIEW
jgi:hypothetical protein